MTVLVCLTFVMLLGIAWTKTISLERRQVRAEHDRLQAECLADSALERAAARLAADAHYVGENWQITPAELGSSCAASVTITVTAIDGEPRRRNITAVADYPAASPERARRTKQIKFILPPAGESP